MKEIQCTRCGEVKSLDSFYVRRLSKKTGEPLYNKTCKDCRKTYMKSYMKTYMKSYQRLRATPESKKKRNERRRERYHSDEKYRKKKLERSARYYRENPERCKEHEAKRRESYSKGIYQIKNIVTGSVYIGSSSAVEERWRGHISKLKRGIHHSKRFQMDYNIYGKDSFVFEIIKESQESADKLRLLERETIKNLEVSGVRLYNKAYTVPKRKVVITVAR